MCSRSTRRWASSARIGPDTQFGLLNTDGDFYSVGVNVTPNQKVALGLSYGKDKYKTLQRSRQANPGDAGVRRHP